MSGLNRKFSAFRMLCRVLPIVLGIAIILAGAFPVSPMHVEHFASNQAQVIAMSDHAIPVDKKVQDHGAHATCSPGVGCFVFTVPAEGASTLTPLGVIIERVDILQLVTRVVAPPLPPPKIIILI